MKDDMESSIPLEQLNGLVLFGNAHVSTGTFAKLLTMGIPTTLLSNTGQFFGRLESTRHTNIMRQRQQFRLGENNGFCISLAKSILSGKIHNQIVILRRYNRYRNIIGVQMIIERLQALKLGIDRAQSLSNILGYEGNAAKLYFNGLSKLVDDDFKFLGRNRMPPRDPFNSMLSLGYTLLMYELYSAVVNKGLNPYAGFIHKDKHGHPSLASDLMEEWRTVIVDSLVMYLVEKNILFHTDFYTDNQSGGVFLTKKALKIFVKEFEKKIRTEADYLIKASSRMSFRRAIVHQIADLCSAIESGDASMYEPVKLR